MNHEIIRTIDDLGRLNLPAELRKPLGWGLGDEIKLHCEGDTIVLTLAKHNDGSIAINPNAQ